LTRRVRTGCPPQRPTGVLSRTATTAGFTVHRFAWRGLWCWRVFRGTTLIAKGAHAQPYDATERDVRALFPQWVTR